MMHFNQWNVAVIFYALTMLALSAVAQQQQQQVSNEVIPEKIDLAKNAREDSGIISNIWPMVKVDQANNKSRTNVHVPIFFDMTSEKGRDNSKLDLTVMHGLVTVSQDKAKDSNGTVSGPLTVTVFGIPVYSGRARNSQAATVVETRRAMARKEEGDKEVLKQQPSADISEKSTPLIRELYLNSRKTNERILKSFSEMLSKVAKNIEHSVETLGTGSGSSRAIDNNVAELAKSSKLNNREDLQSKDLTAKSDNLLSNFLPANPENKAQPRAS